MPLTIDEMQLIIEIDNTVNQVLLENGDDVKIMLAFIKNKNLTHAMESSVKIIQDISRNKLMMYFTQYPGFFLFLRIIDKILGRFSRGEISVKKINEMLDVIDSSRRV